MDKASATTAADLVAVINHTFGFLPTSSVAVLFTDGPKLTASLRVDADPTRDAHQWASSIAGIAAKADGADGAFVVSFEDGQAMTTRQYEALGDALARAGTPIVGAVLVTGGRIMDYEGDSTDAVPLAEAETSPVGLALQFAQTTPRMLAADVPAYRATDPEQAEAIRAHAAAAAGLDAWDAETQALVCGTLRDAIDGYRATGTVSEAHAAWLAGTFTHKQLRDLLAASLVTHAQDAEAIGRALLGNTIPEDWEYLRAGADMLHTALAFIPAPFRAETLSIIAAMRWLDGQSTEAARYCELAQAAEPGHRLSGLLLRLLDGGHLPATATTPH